MSWELYGDGKIQLNLLEIDILRNFEVTKISGCPEGCFLTHTILRYAWCVPGLPFGGTHHAYLKRLAVGIFDIPMERSPCDLIDCSKKAAIDKIRGHII